MTDYVKSTSFASKDALATGNPLKIVKGTEIDTEFNNIAVAVATKADLLSPTFAGAPLSTTPSGGDNTTKIATTAFVVNAISSSAIAFTGSMLMWPTVTAPSGFLLCNGSTVSRTTYAALFAIVGTIFGAGDGVTTFTLPDYRDRMPIGAGTAYSANSLGGSKDSIVPSHTHTASSVVTDPSHNHATNAIKVGGFGTGTFDGSAVSQFVAAANTAATTGITVATTVATTGVSPTETNLPPYLGIYFIIKT